MTTSSALQPQTLTVCVHYEPSGVDPHINAAELGLQMTMGVFDTLVHKLPDGAFLPHLAESWDLSPDQCTYRFTLRRDVKFHDGTPFNADAVKFSLDRARDPANKSQLAGGMLGPYQSAEVLDEYTVAVHLTQPYASFLDALSQGWLAPVSPAAARRLGDDFRRQPVGSGPFIFDAWQAGQYIRLRRNPDYAWAPPVVANRGPAHLSEVTFLFMPNGADRTAALRAGRANGVFYVEPADVAGLRADPAFTVATFPIRGAPVCLMMNMAKPPTDDPAVRRAIKHALNQEAIVREVFHGEFPHARGPLSHFTLGYNPAVEQVYPPDPAKACALLDAAGWRVPAAGGIRQKDGQPARVIFYALPVNFYPEFGRLVRQQLGEVGIDVDVRTLSPADWIRGANAGEHNLVPQGKYASGPQILSFIYHSRATNGAYGWTKRPASFAPELDRLIEQSEHTIAPKEYVPLFERVQEIIMEQALIVPLQCNTNIVALRRGITGLAFDAIGAYPLLHDVRVEGAAE